jgi:hypothetical protein
MLKREVQDQRVMMESQSQQIQGLLGLHLQREEDQKRQAHAIAVLEEDQVRSHVLLPPRLTMRQNNTTHAYTIVREEVQMDLEDVRRQVETRFDGFGQSLDHVHTQLNVHATRLKDLTDRSKKVLLGGGPYHTLTSQQKAKKTPDTTLAPLPEAFANSPNRHNLPIMFSPEPSPGPSKAVRNPFQTPRRQRDENVDVFKQEVRRLSSMRARSHALLPAGVRPAFSPKRAAGAAPIASEAVAEDERGPGESPQEAVYNAEHSCRTRRIKKTPRWSRAHPLRPSSKVLLGTCKGLKRCGKSAGNESA